MRVLFISAFYPPFVIGGWEQLVQDINGSFQERGHVTHVLTSTYGYNKPVREQGVDRLLTLESDIYHYKPVQFLSHSVQVKENLRQVEKVVREFKPDVVFIHGMWNLSKGVAWQAEQLCPGRVVYYVANDWPYAPDLHSAYWSEHPRHLVFDLPKKVVSYFPLHVMEQENKKYSPLFEHVLCVSQAMKENLARHTSIDPNRMRVVYNGVEKGWFAPSRRARSGEERGLSLLFAGSLVPHKGVHTAIEAFALLNRDTEHQDVTLSIVGSGHPDYESYLKKIVSDNHLEGKVRFLGRVSREEMPEVFRKFDVLVFPSTWEEPLARVMQEAMASGMVVVGTLTGGSGELLIDGETGLNFKPGNAAMLAEKIEFLVSDPDLYNRLSINGQNKVLAQFTYDRMIDEMEDILLEIVRQNAPGVAVKPL